MKKKNVRKKMKKEMEKKWKKKTKKKKQQQKNNITPFLQIESRNYFMNLSYVLVA